MAVVLFDTGNRKSLYPFSYTKAVAQLFFGMFTIKERWQLLMDQDVLIETESYLQPLYNNIPDDTHTFINASLLPDELIIRKIKNLKEGDVLENGSGIIACCGKGNTVKAAMENSAINFAVATDVSWLHHPHQILYLNDAFIRSDFALAIKGKISQDIPDLNDGLYPV